MILILAGTQDGREIARRLTALGLETLVSVVSGYGRDLARQDGLDVQAAALDATSLKDLIARRGITLIIDASHPYAVNASRNAMTAAAAAGAAYIRYERPAFSLPEYAKLRVAPSAAEAAKIAASMGKVVFLTTGSRTLSVFKSEPALADCTLIARVLPDPKVLAECLNLGFLPRQIVAVQGPFSHNLNVAMFKEYRADVVVTKNSGTIGGSDTKISAAVELGLGIVVIDRPDMEYGQVFYSVDDVINFVRGNFHG